MYDDAEVYDDVEVYDDLGFRSYGAWAQVISMRSAVGFAVKSRGISGGGKVITWSFQCLAARSGHCE